MQFMNSSLDKPVKNLSDEDFKYLVEEFSSENLELLKQNGADPNEYMNSFERFNEEQWVMVVKYQTFRQKIIRRAKKFGIILR